MLTAAAGLVQSQRLGSPRAQQLCLALGSTHLPALCLCSQPQDGCEADSQATACARSRGGNCLEEPRSPLTNLQGPGSSSSAIVPP